MTAAASDVSLDRMTGTGTPVSAFAGASQLLVLRAARLVTTVDVVLTPPAVPVVDSNAYFRSNNYTLP